MSRTTTIGDESTPGAEREPERLDTTDVTPSVVETAQSPDITAVNLFGAVAQAEAPPEPPTPLLTMFASKGVSCSVDGTCE